MTIIHGFSVSTPVRTGFDIGRWIPPPLSVIFLDSLLAATGVYGEAMREYALQRPGTRGIRRLFDALDVVDCGAESPQKTRTRLLLVEAGLPKPETQIEIRDSSGRFVARIDLGWRRWQVGVEYEGVHHWLEERQRTRDIERFEDLDRAEWRIVRINSEQMRLRPHEIVTPGEGIAPGRGCLGVARSHSCGRFVLFKEHRCELGGSALPLSMAASAKRS
ncbi:hypothetical protein [Rhodococcus sp. 06-235-1A]|uniref:hypothetical protein n=1 Tax=Rhodococcus sp. 06-235-1A TaxID=2022508 RepID=UPI00211AE11B|nr:hypothetical protein [Rhodococcus sp. 06-235-1A]